MLMNTIFTFFTFNSCSSKTESILNAHTSIIMRTMFFEIFIHLFIKHDRHWNGIPEKEQSSYFIRSKRLFMQKALIVTLKEMTCVSMYLG